MEAGTKVVAYIRISSMRQVDNESPATQRDTIQRFADQNGYEIVAWFEDIAKSGKNADRDGLQEMLKFCLTHRGKLKHWLVYNMRRASRDIDTYSTEVRTILKALGVTVRSATEPAVMDTKEGRFMENLLVLLGQLDNEGKSEVTKDNMRSLAHQGYWQHPPIIGYDVAKIPNDLGKPRPTLKQNVMAAKVKKVLERYSDGDMTKAQLTRYAAEIGLRSRYGKKLNEDSIHRLIKSITHAGYVSDSFTNYEPVRGKHLGIISIETWERNQEISNGTKRSGEVRLKERSDYPLKGLLLCPNCMKPLYASAPKTGGGGKSPRYHCSRRSCKGKYKSVKASLVHDEFKEMLNRIEPSEHVLRLYKTILVREANGKLGHLNTQIKALRSDLSELDERRNKAVEKFTQDAITADEKESLVSKLDQEKLDVKRQLDTLTNQQHVREQDIDFAISFMSKVSKQWIVAPFEARLRFQSMIFPEGLVYDSEANRFGTGTISPLYRSIGNKKDPEMVSESFLVAGVGFEPTTSWL